MAVRLTAHAQTVLNLARREAHHLASVEVRGEHVLLAMIRVAEPGIGQMVLRNLGIEVDALREFILEHADCGGEPRPVHLIEMNVELGVALRHARREAAALGCRHVGTEHFLLGLFQLRKGCVYTTLQDHGVSIEVLRDETARLLGLEAPEIVPSRTIPDRADEPGREPGPAAISPKPSRERSPARAPFGDPPLPNFQSSLSRQIEAVLSQLALWSKNPKILQLFSQLNQLLGEATDAALSELNGLDLPEELIEPAVDIFRLSQEKAEAVALSDYRRAGELYEAIERIVAVQAAMSPELSQLAGELIDCEREKQRAVREERYEHAAHCRDRSRTLHARWEQLAPRAPKQGEHSERREKVERGE